MLATALTLGCSLTSGAASRGGDTSILFQDDFSDTGSGWDRTTTDNAVTDYASSAYRIWVNDANSDYWANPGLSFTDVRIEVEATKVGGPDNNDLGVICRYQDTDNFYFALVSSDGFAGIGKTKSGEQSLLTGDNLAPTDAIHQGNSKNAIRLDCLGNSLSLLVNGTQVATITDSDFAKGDVGLMAGTYDAPGTDIQFDNFVVRAP
ncbi:MAG: hypothetical protein NTY23_07555 [Chloroflexi bacterium]|nr:hypothetical protein [Chloroflexota bacterium]